MTRSSGALGLIIEWTLGLYCGWGVEKYFCGTTEICLYKNQHKDKEIGHHQRSSPAATSSEPVTKTLPLNFVAVAVARAVPVAVAVAVAKAVPVALAVARARAMALALVVVVAMAAAVVVAVAVVVPVA